MSVSRHEQKLLTRVFRIFFRLTGYLERALTADVGAIVGTHGAVQLVTTSIPDDYPVLELSANTILVTSDGGADYQGFNMPNGIYDGQKVDITFIDQANGADVIAIGINGGEYTYWDLLAPNDSLAFVWSSENQLWYVARLTGTAQID